MGFWDIFYRIFPDVWFKGMNLRSYTGIIIVDSIKARRRDRVLRRAIRRLKKRYSPDKLGKIENKYINIKQKDPQKAIAQLDQDLRGFIQSFIFEYQIFRAYIRDVLELVDQSLLSGRREIHKELTDVEVVFILLERRANELKFPLRAVRAFESQLARMFLDLKHTIRNDELSDLRVERKGYPVSISALSFLSFRRLWSRRKIFRNERREARKLNRRLEVYLSILQRLEQELQSGQIRQDLLPLTVEFCKLLDAADASMERITDDLLLVLKKLGDELRDVKNSMNGILTLLRNEDEIRADPRFERISNDIMQLENGLSSISRRDFSNVEALRRLLGTLLTEESKIFAIMEQEAVAA